ncbi:MAG: helix-turn-helix domain-containing protein [Armatimonadota bacterium]|nr:helix-turn-helix domain-containing protein [Armatimonadota bacterium]
MAERATGRDDAATDGSEVLPTRPDSRTGAATRGGLDARSRLARLARQEALPIEVPAPRPPRGGRRPFTESREDLIRRLLDPELTLQEASLILNLSKATIRRYTDQGKLRCTRTAGGQRRFRLSDLLALMEGQDS